MGLRDCLISAAEQNAITREEASILADDFEVRFAQNRLSMGDDLAAAKARKDMEAGLKASALEKRRQADLTEAARLRTLERLQQPGGDGATDVYRNGMAILSHYGFRNGSSVRGRSEAIIAAAHGKLTEVMRAFERDFVLGKRANRALESDMVKALHGEVTGDATAKYLAEAIETVFEDLRLRFNAAGGSIGKLENFGLPHSHDRLKIKAMGRQGWKDMITPLIDPDRTVDPLTGQPVGGRLDAMLDHMYDNIVSEGRAHLTPQARPTGKGAIARQRQDERILQFRDAASWEAYHRAAGRGDITQVIFNHINGMAKDIAAMELLGPNPAMMVDYIKQVVSLENGKLEAGLPSRAKPGKLITDSKAALDTYRIDSLWQALRGTPTVVSGWSNFTANVKNTLTAAQLGGTVILAAATDPFISRSARQLAGLPVTAAAADMVKLLKKSSRDEITRSGVMLDEYLHVMGDELRFAGPAVGSEWSRWLADRAVTWSGLKPLTTGRKLIEARAWQSHIADLAREGKNFAKLDPRLKRTLEGFGVTQAHWDIWKQGIDPNGFVTPRQIEIAGGPVNYLDMNKLQISDPAYVAEKQALDYRDAAEKLAELTTSWSERSVPSGTVNARSAVTGLARRGTVTGEILDYMLQYKSFGLSFTALQLEAIGEMGAARNNGTWRTGAAYFAALAVPLTIGAGLSIQLRSMLDGKEPEDMTKPGFWVKSALTGGGFGLFGDFAKASENRFGQSPLMALAGPGLAFLGDAWQLSIGNVLDAMRQETDADGNAKPLNVGREAVKFLGRYTPVASSHWAVRGAYRRVVLDNLQWLADPAADKSFKAQADNARRNGTEFFVPPGTLTPSREAGRPRVPDIGSALGR